MRADYLAPTTINTKSHAGLRTVLQDRLAMGTIAGKTQFKARAKVGAGSRATLLDYIGWYSLWGMPILAAAASPEQQIRWEWRGTFEPNKQGPYGWTGG